MSETLSERIRRHVREFPDFPKPGLRYRDVTPIVQDPVLFRDVIDALAERFEEGEVDVICGVEARGFIFGGALAYRLGLPFIPIHWAGKLPKHGAGTAFDLEYRFDALAAHRDAVAGGRRVLLIDDFLATGATLEACADLVRSVGGRPVAAAVIVEADTLEGREKLPGIPLVSLCVLGGALD